MIQRLLLLLLLTLTCGARPLVRLKDGSYGVVLQKLDGKALVAVTPMSLGGFDETRPHAEKLPWKELHSTQKEAQGLAVLIDPKPPTNLRSAPNGPVLHRLDGKSALILLKAGDWHEVMTGDGTIGYVHSSMVSIVQLDYPQAEIDAVWKPLAAHHRDWCNKPSTDARKRMYLSITFGPCGRVVIDTHGKLVLRETWSQDLSQGFSPDRQWLAISQKLVDAHPPYLADYSYDPMLYHKVGGSYQMVLDVPLYFTLSMLHAKGVPDSVIRGLCLPLST